MKITKSLFLLLMTAVILAGCGSEPLNKMEYTDFKETITQDDFTGFAYILSDFHAEERNYISVIEEVFQEEGETLIYYNDLDSPDEVHEQFNEDSGLIELYLPDEKVAYIEGGQPVSELEVTEELMKEGNHETLKQFIQDHK